MNHQHLYERYDQLKEYSLGYPCNLAYDYTDVFKSFKYNINNIGDPFIPSLYKTNTKEAEKKVLRFFADLWHFDKNNSWGCLVESGSIGNLQGIYIGREVFPKGVLFFSEDSHYSVKKVARILRLPYKIVKSRENGEMDYDDFERKINETKTRPIILCANLGSTMKGAIDDPRELYRILCKYGKQNEYYMHGDGALMGFALPFMEYDLFYKKCLHSISISGHKFLGCPFPCGVFMMERRFLEKINNSVEYIGSIDNTISGSRNGHSALFLEYIIDKRGKNGFKRDVLNCIDNSEYLMGRMRDIQKTAWRNNNSFTVVIDRPHEKVLKKWQLPTYKKISHIIVMPHVTRTKIDHFMKDLVI